MKTKKLRISLVGRTNAGKSTLINRIVGEKISIQNKKINTTQDTIIGIKNIKESQLLFYDTPGSNFLKNLDSQSKKLKKNIQTNKKHQKQSNNIKNYPSKRTLTEGGRDVFDFLWHSGLRFFLLFHFFIFFGSIFEFFNTAAQTPHKFRDLFTAKQ